MILIVTGADTEKTHSKVGTGPNFQKIATGINASNSMTKTNYALNMDTYVTLLGLGNRKY